MRFNKYVSKPFFTRDNWAFDLVLLGGLVFTFYILWLGGHTLFNPDESRYSEVAREMIATKDFITPRVNGVAFLDKPVLHYWLQVIAMALFGIKEWSLRIFPMLFGIAGCLLTYVTARTLFDRQIGLISAIVLSTSPLYFGGAHYANLDLEVAVLISCSLFAFLLAIQDRNEINSSWLLAFYIFASLAFLTKGMIGIVFPLMIIGIWMLMTKQLYLLKHLKLLTGSLIFIAIVLPWYAMVQRQNPGFLHYFFVTQQISRFLSAAEFNNKTAFWFYIPITVLGFFPWTLFLLQTVSVHFNRWFRSPNKFQYEIFFVIWFAFIFVFFSIPRSKTIGYILPIFPALSIIVGYYVSLCSRQSYYFTKKNVLLLYPLVASFIAIFLLQFKHFKMEINPSAILFMQLNAGLFLSSAVISLWCFYRQNIRQFFILCVITNVIMLLMINYNAEYFNLTSSKPLLAYLKKIAKPNEEIVNYYKYYQDIPLYLNAKNKRISIVADWNATDLTIVDNWRRELWFGMPFQKTDQWLINEDEFWNRWESNRRVFVFVNINFLQNFKARAKFYFWIDQYQDIILLSNQPTYTT